MWRGDLRKVTKTFYSGDLKSMSDQKTVRGAWTTYKDSPYATYMKGLEGIYGKQEGSNTRPEILSATNG